MSSSALGWRSGRGEESARGGAPKTDENHSQIVSFIQTGSVAVGRLFVIAVELVLVLLARGGMPTFSASYMKIG